MERPLNAAGGYINTKYQGVDLKYIKEKKSSKTTNLKRKKRRREESQQATCKRLIFENS